MIRKVLMLSAALAIAPAYAQYGAPAQPAKPAQPAPSAQPMVKDAVGTAEAVKITAKITAIDPATRTLTVVGPKGKTVSLVAGDNVKNFAQIKVGDEIVLRYMEAVTVALEKSTADRSMTQSSSGPMAAAPGARPGVGATATTTIVANVQSVDAASQSVVLEGPNGKYVEVKVKDPAVFKQVKANDKVKVTYTEAMLLDVETSKK